MTVAHHNIADILDRAQLCFPRTVDHTVSSDTRREAVAWFIHHVTTAVLLEHLRRLDPDLADRLCPWLLGQDGIFADGYAGELLHQWREQLAAAKPLDPIGPGDIPDDPLLRSEPTTMDPNAVTAQPMDGRCEP